MSAAVTLSLCPTYAPALGFAGAMIALVMACVGSAYGTGKAAMGISSVGVEQPEVHQLSGLP
jgi:V-type H+-transporting ATPase proteolipid subunit